MPECFACHRFLNKADFAKTQLKKSAAQRKCRKCCEESSLLAAAPAASTSNATGDGNPSDGNTTTARCSASVLGCTIMTASLVCARCKSATYCSKACQIQHYKEHKLICRYIEKNRGEKLSKSELKQSIKPWTRSTTYEQKDIDFEAFEKCYEKDIAEFAATHKNDDEAGFVIVDVGVIKRPLTMVWQPLKNCNKRNNAKVSKKIQAEMKEGFHLGQYIVMAVWGGPKYGIQYERDATWIQTPIQFFQYGGRGSQFYQGPQHCDVMAHVMASHGMSRDTVEHMLTMNETRYATNDVQRRMAKEEYDRDQASQEQR